MEGNTYDARGPRMTGWPGRLDPGKTFVPPYDGDQLLAVCTRNRFEEACPHTKGGAKNSYGYINAGWIRRVCIGCGTLASFGGLCHAVLRGCGSLCAPREAGPPERLNRTCGLWSCFDRRLCSSLGCLRARALGGCAAGAGRRRGPKRIPHSRTAVLLAARPLEQDWSHMRFRGPETGPGKRDGKSPGGGVHRQSVDTPSRGFSVPFSRP